MKKLTVALLLVMLAVMLTGCVRMEADIKIRNKGVMDVTMIMAMSENSGAGFDINRYLTVTNSLLEEQQKAGWRIERYNEDEFTGYVSTVKNMPVDADLAPIGISPEEGAIRKEGDRYILEFDLFHIDTQSELEEKAIQLQGVRNLGGSMKIRIRFPSVPLRTTGTTVSDDGRTMEWDLLDPTVMGIVYAEYTDQSIWMTVAIAGLVCVVVLIALYFIIRIKKSRF